MAFYFLQRGLREMKGLKIIGLSLLIILLMAPGFIFAGLGWVFDKLTKLFTKGIMKVTETIDKLSQRIKKTWG